MGRIISYLPEHQRSASIGRLFQDPMKGTTPNLTIEENLALAYSKNTKGLSDFTITKKDREMFREQLETLLTWGWKTVWQLRLDFIRRTASGGYFADEYHCDTKIALG